MFHSSSFRHEQYLIRSGSGSKHTLHKKLPSLDSKISAVDTDSECSSSSSSPTYSTVSSPTLTTSFSTTTSTLNTSEPTKKTPHPRRKKRTQTASQRPPDLVYSCPRPLAFPFHNDDHFLPIAEADPRDVARVAPQVNRSYSIQSKGSLNRDSESSFSRHSSILSSIQQGTVRSIRSLFSLQSLSQLTTATTATQSSGENTTKYQPLERLEIKQGTVQSLRDFFTRGQQQPEDKKSDSVLSCPLPPTETEPANHRKSLYSRASEFASRALWGTPTTEPTSSTLESQPETPEPRKSFASEIKKFSVRVISSWMPTKSNEAYTKVQEDEQPSKVGQLWNSFKCFMTGKKSSRVGPISI
ncbi:hypothetical protein G6F46_007204 [Rhizopus delemar]|uniref:Uncharacterized protein n=3 Tax=Rhizopus TaxID=4842 RepID=I1BKM5_RHIO9|nr:hypothetical protein RO3G_01459 [Rhizopus delemar RA 99-880]KAG1054425.1 hypothetical protein G6F43_003557 [Rhizopus delemar]KAG1542037.1 hypothetical protein G6F51_007521 [Rhizopus arrhizus]KAG1457189.1 hypothetical protein G6F55_006075 [Rhizopus delemar]KAG1496234.1 hypothetical protein G6F54_006615 [Rhizopus delemar]|eukprot:EIE76755.1 hypothetical protein RO3G_01459 [Rhizopus delemar RA 99-880]